MRRPSTLLLTLNANCLVLVACLFHHVASAKADLLNVPLTGWEAYDDLGLDARNTEQVFNIGAGSQVTAVRWVDLAFESFDASSRSALTFSLARSNAVQSTEFWDFAPATALQGPGTYGPLTGNFGPGLLGSGPFSVRNDGQLFVSLYAFPEANAGTTGILGREARISAGTLEVTFIRAVPEPGSIALVCLMGGLCGMVASRKVILKRVRSVR
jgi:hypothetical protein